MAWYDDPFIVIAVAVVIIIAVGIVVFAMRRMGKNPKAKKPQKAVTTDDPSLDYSGIPFKISKSVQTSTASNAKDELRMLDLEREILGDAIRRLYEAQAEGKITESEREKLAASYKARMMAIKDSISKDETIVALHDLEGMQEDLMKLFSERFGELTSKVEELRTRIDVKPIKEVPIKLPTQMPASMERIESAEEEEEEAEAAAGEEKQKKKRKPPEEKPTAKTEAEKRIESIRSEVEKVLDKLGQMEIES
jgi:translation initiation factor 5B